MELSGEAVHEVHAHLAGLCFGELYIGHTTHVEGVQRMGLKVG